MVASVAKRSPKIFHIMITVPEATRKIIERSRYLSEAISKKLINYSALARYIKPEIEEMLIKKVSIASIIMALNRLEKDFTPKYVSSNIFTTKPQIVVNSGLFFVSLSNNEVAGLSLLLSREQSSKSLYLKNQGIHETTFILSRDLFDKFKTSILEKNPLVPIEEVSAVSISLPQEALKTPGIYYFFLKSLAWEGINIIETVSTLSEFTIIVSDKDTEHTFSIIKSLFYV